MAKLQRGGLSSLEVFIISKVKKVVVRPTANAPENVWLQQRRLDMASKAAFKQAHQLLEDENLSREEQAARSLELDMDS